MGRHLPVRRVGCLRRSHLVQAASLILEGEHNTMRTIRFVGLLLVSLLVIAGTAAASANHEYNATLLSSNEVPPHDTAAHGVAQFHVSNDGLSVRYTLNVT